MKMLICRGPVEDGCDIGSSYILRRDSVYSILVYDGIGSLSFVDKLYTTREP